MGWFDALFGRSRLPKPKTEGLFTLATAGIDLEADAGWRPMGRAGLCLKPSTATEFGEEETSLRELLALGAREMESQVEVSRDEFGYLWYVVSDRDLPDQVALLQVAVDTIEEAGWGTQLLCAAFRFQATTPEDGEPKPRYLIYHFKRGRFYPFVPMNDAKRDHADELRLKAVAARFLPIEPDFSAWFPLWGCPV